MEGRITNTLHNGFVFILGDDGKEYITHAQQVGFKTKKNRQVSFDPGENPAEDGKYPWAHNVQRLEFAMVHDGSAEWLGLPEEFRKPQVKLDWCRCSCCGEVSTNAWNYCPKCGAAMARTDEIKQMAKEVYSQHGAVPCPVCGQPVVILKNA